MLVRSSSYSGRPGWSDEKRAELLERNWHIWSDYKSTPMTLRAVGEKYGRSQERVRQIVCKHDRMMRNPERKAKYYWGA